MKTMLYIFDDIKYLRVLADNNKILQLNDTKFRDIMLLGENPDISQIEEIDINN